MLPAAARMRRRAEFTSAIRAGRRAASPRLVVHFRGPDDDGETRVGFIIGRSVGAAVVRNRVRRQLRHLMRGRLARVPAGSRVVVRANPSAAGSSSAVLASELDRALDRALTAGARR